MNVRRPCVVCGKSCGIAGSMIAARRQKVEEARAKGLTLKGPPGTIWGHRLCVDRALAWLDTKRD